MRSRTSKAALVAALVAVVLLVRGTRRQARIMDALGVPRRPPRVGWWRAQAALWHAVTALGLRWPWDGVVDSVTGFFGTSFDYLKGWLQAIVDAMADAVWRVLDGLTDTLARLWNVAYNLYDAAKQFALDQLYNALVFVYGLIDGLRAQLDAVYNGVIGFARGLVDDLRTWTGNLVSAVYGTVTGWLDTLRGWVADLVRAVYSTVAGWVGQARDLALAVIDTLRGWVADLVRAVYDTVAGWVAAARDALLAALDALRGWAADLVRDALGLARSWVDFVNDQLRSFFDAGIRPVADYLFGTVESVVDVVLAVLDWLQWLARWPFAEAVDAWNTLFRTSGADLLAHIEAAHRDRGPAAAAQVARRVS